MIKRYTFEARVNLQRPNLKKYRIKKFKIEFAKKRLIFGLRKEMNTSDGQDQQPKDGEVRFLFKF